MGGAGLGPAQAAAAGAGAADNSESLTKFGGTSPGGISESNRLPGIIRMILIYVGFEMRYFRAQVHRSNTICNRDSHGDHDSMMMILTGRLSISGFRARTVTPSRSNCRRAGAGPQVRVPALN